MNTNALGVLAVRHYPMSKIALLALYMSLILTSSLIPMDREIEGLNFIIGLNPSIQNLLHVPAYAILSILWLQVVGGHMDRRKRLLLAFSVSIGFGIFNELIQLAVPRRYPSIVDICSNTIGALGGVLLYLILERNVVFSPQRHRAR
jgi:glycopeptide antibiotics resistance protein